MFTVAMAQESVDLSTGTFGGKWGNKDSRSQWTSANGVSIMSYDANYAEVASMRYYNNRFQLEVNENVATPVKYTITVPEGYIITEMKVKNSAKSHNAHVDYDLSSYSLHNTTAEKTIQFVEGVNEFYLYGEVGRSIYITSLTVTNTTAIEEVKNDNAAGIIYDLCGRKIENITKPGIYIVGGKKVFVK